MKQRFVCLGRQWILLVLFCLPILAIAAEAIALYAVEVPLVAGAPDRDRSQLAGEALQQAIQQITGSKAVLKNPAVMAALKKPDAYVNQFSYHERPTGERFVKVSFHEKKMDQLLSAFKQSIWKNTRPLTLIWLITETEKPQWVVGAPLEKTMKEPFQKSLTARGVPYLFPLFDLQDVQAVSEQDVVAQNEPPFLAATKRYEADASLLGQLKQVGATWEARWALLGVGVKSTWQNKGSNLEILLEDAAEILAEKLSGVVVPEKSQKNAESGETEATPGVSSAVVLNVLGISSAEQYTKVLESLHRLPFVTGVEVVQVTPQKTVFSLKTTAGEEKIGHAIAEVPLLVQSKIVGEDEAHLTYRLVGAP
jgi:hypothetical protein